MNGILGTIINLCKKKIGDESPRTCKVGGGWGSRPSVMWLLAWGLGKGYREPGSEPCSLPRRLNIWASPFPGLAAWRDPGPPVVWPLWLLGPWRGRGKALRGEAGGWWRLIKEGPAWTSQALKGQSAARRESASDTVRPGAALPFWASVSSSVEWEWGRRAEEADDLQGPFWLLGDDSLSEPPPMAPARVGPL